MDPEYDAILTPLIKAGLSPQAAPLGPTPASQLADALDRHGRQGAQDSQGQDLGGGPDAAEAPTPHPLLALLSDRWTGDGSREGAGAQPPPPAASDALPEQPSIPVQDPVILRQPAVLPDMAPPGTAPLAGATPAGPLLSLDRSQPMADPFAAAGAPDPAGLLALNTTAQSTSFAAPHDVYPSHDIGGRASPYVGTVTRFSNPLDGVAARALYSLGVADQNAAPNSASADDIIGYTNNHKDAINSTAAILGIPASAIAGSFGEEYRTFQPLKDPVVDLGGMLVVNNATGHTGESGDDILNELYAKDAQKIHGGVVQGSVASRITDPLRLDIGVGNFNFGTAMYLLKDYLAKNPSYPLKLGQYSGHPAQLYNDMLDNKSDTFVKLVGLKIRQAQDFFMNNEDLKIRDYAREYYTHLSPAQRDEMLDAFYRTSKATLVHDAKTRNLHPYPRREYYQYFTDPRSPYQATSAILGQGRR